MKFVAPELSHTKKVRVVHLADHTGRLQVIFPEDSMLDLAAIARLTKRRFEPIANYNTAGDPLLATSNCPSIIESNLLKESFLQIRSNADGQYQQLSTDDVMQRFSGPLCRFENISIHTDDIQQPSDDYLSDEQQMLNSLGQFQSIRLKQRLEETLEIPPLPAISNQIIRLSSNESSGMDELCDVISLDPSLAAQVVSWAASPYYGAKGGIESVKDAIIRVLGYDMVMNLALGLSMGNAFSEPEEGPRHYEDFWLSSVSHAALMEALVTIVPVSHRPSSGHAYLTGLLHNFGFLAISTMMPPHFSILSRYQEANAHLSSDIVEMQILRFTKEQLGSWLLKQWDIPENICLAVRYSKTPSYQGEYANLANLLYIAHQLNSQTRVNESVLSRMGISLEQAEACYSKVQQSSAELYKMVALINGKKS
ncbi:HDOD domain-containing protein [Marinomonas pollencensis]|uniref:HD-like signal output (HDOD) protein n=1 Tax=Marinomonas pollencensis TaxID=491954 RepID=A0A3E0DMD2_9GAMM|nr:HDOD domain-containing protein [Marinomonas pollencensis]REG83921.1 HD-like signal output (HDOD) protein [Marinomonas pollencensis]